MPREVGRRGWGGEGAATGSLQARWGRRPHPIPPRITPAPSPPQVLEHCREVYGDRQARAGGDEAGGTAAAAQSAAAAAQTAAAAKAGSKAPTAKEVAFRAVVSACRKRGGAAAAATPSKPTASGG